MGEANLVDGPGRQAIELREWFARAIQTYRSMVGGAQADSSPLRVGFDNLGPPLQVHVLWTQDPEFQFIVYTKFPTLPDGQVTARGPFPIWEVFDHAEQFLAEPQWTNYIDPSVATGAPGERLTTFREALEPWLINELSNIQTGLYSQRVNGMVTTRVQEGPRCWLATVTGNIAASDPVEFARRAAQTATATPRESTKEDVADLIAQLSTARAVEVGGTTVRSAVTYFSPSIYVGPLPTPKSFKERFHRQYIPRVPERVVDVDTGQGRLIIHRNGYVLVVGREPADCLGLINMLFAVARLDGFGSLAVPLAEVGGAEFDPVGDGLVGWWNLGGSSRWRFAVSHDWTPAHPTQAPTAKEVGEQAVMSVAETTLKLVRDEEVCRDLLFWLQAATYLESFEYEPCFALAWIVLERWLTHTWSKLVKEQGLRGKKRKEMRGSDWVEGGRHSRVMDLRSKRNMLFHQGKTVDKETASSATSLAEEVVREAVEHLLAGLASGAEAKGPST